jgi:hypothetical protein
MRIPTLLNLAADIVAHAGETRSRWITRKPPSCWVPAEFLAADKESTYWPFVSVY